MKTNRAEIDTMAKRFEKHQIEALKSALEESEHLTKEKKIELVAATGLDVEQIASWFSRKRARKPHHVTAPSTPYADCTTLNYGGSCNNIGEKGNISYAFNSYYQLQKQNPKSCEFDGLGMVTFLDPSVGDCRFLVGVTYGNSLGLSLNVNVRFFVACYAKHFIVGKAMDVETFEIENEQARLSHLLHNHAKLKLQNGDDDDNDIEFLPPLPNDFRELLICNS